MIVIDRFNKIVKKETLKEFIKSNGEFSISTEEHVVDVYLLLDKFFLVKNGEPILSRKTFNGIWNWIDNTDCQWELQDEIF